MNHCRFAAQIEHDMQSGMYIAFVPTLAGAHTKAVSLHKLHENLKEAIARCFEELTHEDLDDLWE